MSEETKNTETLTGAQRAAVEAESIAAQAAELRNKKYGSKVYRSLAGLLYTKYCDSVGGVAFNGDKLPGWAEFSVDPKKEKQIFAWLDVAIAAERAVRTGLLNQFNAGLIALLPMEELMRLQQRACEFESMPEEGQPGPETTPGAASAVTADPASIRALVDREIPIHPDEAPKRIIVPGLNPGC